ncbi:MAG TPA: hypothetical protein ENJ01_11915 [Gammaproteobacteria bacterium]|nr:hypothetical protein [Gammaproteobacteria bacterium]
MDPTYMGNDEAGAILAVMGGFMLVFVAIMIVVAIFYLLSLSKALSLAGENNRQMSPGLVWLNLIPIFSLGWHFYTVAKVAEAIRNKYAEAGVDDPGNGGWPLGLTVSILNVVVILPIPFINMLVAIALLVVWIIYWVKIAGYNKAMASMAAPATA